MDEPGKKIRTMGGDIADFSAKPRVPKPFKNLLQEDSTPKRRRSKIPWIIISLVAALALAGGGYYAYSNFFSPEARRPTDEDVPEKLINAGEKIIILENYLKLPEELEKIERLEDGKFAVAHLSQTKNGARHFLTPLEFSYAAELHPPEKLFKAIGTYNLGFVGVEEKNQPFLIFEVKDQMMAQDGMSSWEKFMPQELSLVFSFDGGANLKEGKFSDRIIRNQNVRVFNSSSTEIVHSIYNQKLVIITSSQKAFEAIIDRYSIFPPN